MCSTPIRSSHDVIIVTAYLGLAGYLLQISLGVPINGVSLRVLHPVLPILLFFIPVLHPVLPFLLFFIPPFTTNLTSSIDWPAIGVVLPFVGNLLAFLILIWLLKFLSQPYFLRGGGVERGVCGKERIDLS